VRLFLDANVLFTAAYSPGGRAAALFELSRLDVCTLVTSAHAVEETRRNLALKAPQALESLSHLVDTLIVMPEADRRLVRWATDQGLPANDAPILAAATACNADLLVTGDRTYFGHLYGARVGGVEVLSPAHALARILE